MASAAAMTGGTPALRQAAAQRAVKGPRVVSQRAQPTRSASGPPRLPTSSPVHQAKASSKPAGKSGGKPATAFNPMSGFLNSQQLGELANQITKQNLGTQLAPLRQQAKEIQGTEGTVAKRYGGYSEATDKLLQGIGQDTENNAKTYENQAADAVLKAGQAVNQTGQTAQAQNGGYLDPQVQAQLNAQGQLATSVGGAQNSFAQAAGQNEQNFMGNLRAAAAQRALEGQSSIHGTYAAQLGKNTAQQRELVAKQPADAKSLETELGQKQFTDYATLQGLGIKQTGVQQAGEKIKLTAKQNNEHDRLTERGQNITVTKNAAQTRVDERKLAETERHNRASESTSAERARAYVKKANGGLSTPQQDKVSGEIGTAYNVVQQLRTANVNPQEIRNTLTTGGLRRVVDATNSSGKKYTKEVTYKYPKIGNQTLVTAAFELWDYHKISPQTAQALKGMGVAVSSEMTNGSFKGF
jgi:hypothetical protein